MGAVKSADVIRTARTRSGLSQAELARRAGTSQPVISAYEHGRRDATVETLRRLVAATGEQLQLRLAERTPDQAPATSAAESAERLVDVLLLADALPAPRRGRLEFPRLSS